MRHRWLRSLALLLGFLVLGRCVLLGADTPAPNIEPYLPMQAPPKVIPAVNEEPAPAATLDRPLPLGEERPAAEQKIQPTGLFSNNGPDTFAFSPVGAMPTARPLPVGPTSNSTPLPVGPTGSSTPLPMPTAVPYTQTTPDVPYSWRQAPAPTPVPTMAPQNVSTGPLAPIPSISSGAIIGSNPTMAPGTVIGANPAMPPGTVITSPSMSPGSIVSPGNAPMPGVVTGPMGAPLVEGGVLGNDCCAPGCCAPGCCPSDCCTPGCCDGACCDGCGCWGGCCGGCCFGNRWFGSAEYLLWFVRGQNFPALLTSGSVADAVPGALGQAGTTVLYGNNIYNNNPYSGLRLRGGYWFDDNHLWGVDLGGFFLGGKSNSFSASSAGVPFLGRPFFNALTGAQDVEAVAAPSGLAGTFTAINTLSLYGADVNLRRNLCCGCNWFLDGFVGWRFLDLNESLSMTENLGVYASTNPAIPAGSVFRVNDRFGTNNLFNGVQVGLAGEYRIGRWSLDARNAVGLGGTQQYVNISGSTFTAGPGIAPTTMPGGLLALSSNIGPHTRGVVSFMDEVTLNLGYQFTNHIRAFVGYNFLFLSSVVRPAEQIDRVVNPNLLPPATPVGPNRPAFSFNGSNFWVQGINFGIDIRW